MNWLTTLLGPVTTAFNQWRDRKHEIKLAQHQLKVTEVETEAKIIVSKAEAAIRMNLERQAADINWEIESIRNSGWKDEYITILFTVPAIAIFFPYAQDYVEAGFMKLQSTPMWYQAVLMAIVGSALGVRIWDSFFKPLMAGRQK